MDTPSSPEGAGDLHETDCYDAMSAAATSEYFSRCGKRHVLPTVMLLKIAESHFYGLRHAWYTSRSSPARVRNVEKYKVNPLGFTVMLAGKVLDLNTREDNINVILHTCLTARQRLGIVHLQLGWPILDELDYNEVELGSLMFEATVRFIKWQDSTISLSR
ncbi:hypothetical protein PI124_g16129 [Phytophthora idaei]|nr:hypothetical protein PI125_g16509 [Phytophthora idaei]KAG3238922.1 hypothetical protein PI124_g16129 [Phytophthora idaei]